MRATTLLLALSATLAVAVADLAGAKKEGIRRVNSLMEDMKKLADDTSIEVGKREENIKIISKHAKEFGDGIAEKTTFEVKKSAMSGYMMAKLLGSRDDVFRCIESREREALNEIGRYYNERFLAPGRDFENKAEAHQRDLIKAWKDDYYEASRQYRDIYAKALVDIQKATKEPDVAAIVRRFEETTKQMADIILRIHRDMAKIHITVLQTFDQLVRSFQKYSYDRVDDTIRAIQNCFPRTFENEEPEPSPVLEF